MSDARLPAALARAAEEIKTLSHQPHLTKLHAYLAGWAEAIQALLERPESEHDGGCSAGISKLPCKCSQQFRIEAIARFITAMLGKEAGDE